ncbi:MAG: MFS transporter [Candidatus Aenigmatarchaeota archaeon]
MQKKNKNGTIYYGWFVVLGAFLALLISSVRSYSFGVFILPLTEEFGWPRGPLTLGFSLSLLMTSFLGIVSGKLSDRYGVKKVMLVGTVFIVLGFTLTSQITSLLQLYGCFILIGVGASAFYIPVTTTVTRWFDERRGLAIGISVTALAFGMAFFPPILERVIASIGWRSTFVVIGVFSLAVLSLSTFLMKSSPESPKKKKTAEVEEEGYTLKGALKTKHFWVIYFMFLVAQFSAMTITVHIVPYSMDVGIPSFYAATLLTAVGIANIFGRIFGGWTSDKLGVIKGVTIFFLLQSIAIFSLPVSTLLWILYPVALLFGLAYGGWVMIYPVIISRLFGTEHSGEILGALGTVAGIGGSLGPLFAGYIFDLTGVYDLAFLVSGVMCVGALALSLVFLWFFDAP